MEAKKPEKAESAKQVKKGDFIELDFTGMVKEGSFVFDTTSADVAKKNNAFDEHHEYKPVTVCVGQKQVVPGLDEALEGKETGKEYEISLGPEKAFGKKSAKLIQLVPTKELTKKNITPVPGMPLNIDGTYAVIKTVTGGRTMVDFNHPLSGKDIVYKFRIVKIIQDEKEKLESFLSGMLGLKKGSYDLSIKNGEANVKLQFPVPKEIQENISKKLAEIVPSIKKLEFVKIEEKKQNPAT